MANRYVVGLQRKEDKTVYGDIDDAATIVEAKEKADKLAESNGRPCIIWDEKKLEFVYKTDTVGDLPAEEEPVKKKAKPSKKEEEIQDVDDDGEYAAEFFQRKSIKNDTPAKKRGRPAKKK